MAQLITITNPLTGQPQQVIQSDYTAQQIDNAVEYLGGGQSLQAAIYTFGVKPRDNILPNWCFIGGGQNGNLPINQQGQTSYNGTKTIDMWSFTSNRELSIESNAIVFSAMSGYGYFRTQLPTLLSEGPFTISALTPDGGIESKTIQTLSASGLTLQNGLYLYVNGGFFNIRTVPNESSSISAVKLEYGENQTLGYQNSLGAWELFETPSYQIELLKCQRYYQIYRTQSLRPQYAADCRPVMAKDPAQGTIVIGGVTYYYNDAT